MSYSTTPSLNDTDDLTVARHLEITVHALLRAIVLQVDSVNVAAPEERGPASYTAKTLAEAVQALSCWPNMNPHGDIVTTLEKIDAWRQSIDTKLAEIDKHTHDVNLVKGTGGYETGVPR